MDAVRRLVSRLAAGRSGAGEAADEDKARERLEAFTECSDLFLWELDSALRLAFVSPGWREISAVDPLGLGFWDLAARRPGDEGRWRGLRGTLEARRPIEGFRFTLAGAKEPRKLEIRGRPFFDADGAFSGYRGTALDVTARVEAERRAAAAQRVLIDAIESIPEGVVLWAPNGELMLCNNRYLELFPKGRRPSPELPGPGEARELNVAGRWLQIRHHRMEDGCIVGIYTDVTELGTAKEEAEDAHRAKTRFLAAASHDLRQPLQALGLFAAALSQTELPPAARTLVTRLENSLESLESLLNSLLDISKLEAGVVEPELSSVPLGPMLRRLVAEFAPVASAKGLRLRMVDTKAVLRTDPTLLERILRNLLSNAIRYTKEGKILVGGRRRGSTMRIGVWDTGIGIPAAQQREIFREFHRVKGDARSEGVGLGLAIVERSAALLSHHVEVVSREGKGSAFLLDVPLMSRMRTPGPGAARPSADFAGALVMVIDDDPVVRDALASALTAWKCRPMAAASYADAVARLGLPEVKELAAIVADYRLEDGRTGAEAITAIRKELNREVPAMIVTGDTHPERLRQAHAHGLPLLHKPVRPEALQDALQNILGPRDRLDRAVSDAAQVDVQ